MALSTCLTFFSQDYADPLRNFAKKKEEALLAPYEAKTLFGNIDEILVVNEAFLLDLEKILSPSGEKHVGGLGDVCLKHVSGLQFLRCHYSHTTASFGISAPLNVTRCIIPSEKKHRQYSSEKWQRKTPRDSLHILRCVYRGSTVTPLNLLLANKILVPRR